MTVLQRMTLTVLAAAMSIASMTAFAHDEAKYPDWSGQWRRPQGVGIQWDPTKPLGPAQQARIAHAQNLSDGHGGT